MREIKYGKSKKSEAGKELNEFEKEPITQTNALAFFIKEYLNDPTQFDSNAKLTFYHKLARLNNLGRIAAVAITTLLSFFVFLLLNGFLWQ